MELEAELGGRPEFESELGGEWVEFESEQGGGWVELGQEDGVGAGTGTGIWLGEVTRSCLFP